MTATLWLEVVGWSHLLQPPLTAVLASRRGLDVRTAIHTRSALAQGILHNMAVTAVMLPTTLGLLLVYHARDVLEAGAARSLAALLSAFWCWRLYRQLAVLGPRWPSHSRSSHLLHLLLTAIFVLQGPILGALLLSAVFAHR
ncbi:MAG: hypothetical protein ACOY0T_36485 [Myxococcota bacterium]